MSKYFATGAQLQAAINELPQSFKGSYVAFDASFYKAQYMVGYTGTLSPVEHFVQIGAPAMALPNPNFDPTFYANQYPDLKAAGLDAADLLIHYLKFGLNEGRAGTQKMADFDAGAYLLKYADVATFVAANVKQFENSMEYGARAHFVKFGMAEGRDGFYKNADQVLTLKDATVTRPVAAELERVIMWGYNPHGHGETGVDNLDGNNPDGNDNNLTNEGPADGGVPIEALFEYLETVSGLDFVQLGLINVANGTDDGLNNGSTSFGVDSSVQAQPVGVTVTNSGSGDPSSTITVTYSDGTVNTAEVALGELVFKLFQDALFDNEGNSRLYEVTRATEDSLNGPASVTVKVPGVLTTSRNNGSTEEPNAFTGSGNDTIVAGRLELLHGAYIDAGAGNNTLEIDAKGYFAQPKELLNIQTIRIENLPNIYTDVASGNIVDGYPDVNEEAAAETDSIIDISRAIHLQKLVITESGFEGVGGAPENPGATSEPGQLTIAGIRNGAEATLDGSFTQDVTLHYSDMQGKGANIVLNNVNFAVGAQLVVAHNSPTLNVKSTGGGNYISNGDLGAADDAGLTNLNISGDAKLHIDGDLDGSFTDGTPATIDARTNTAGVDLELTHDDEIVFYGTASADDHFVADSGRSVSIVGGNGNGEFHATGNGDIVITAGNGANEIFADSNGGDQDENEDNVTVTVGNGQNDITVTSSDAFFITAGDGNNRIEAALDNIAEVGVTERDTSTITVGNGQNEIDAGASVLVINAGNGANEIDATGRTVTINSGTGNDVMRVVDARSITINSTGADLITIGGNSPDFVDSADGALIRLTLGTGATVTLGDGGFVDNITAHPDSFITGTNLTLFVDTVADLRAATLTGITRVVLDDDRNVFATSPTANEGGDGKALLTLSSAQVAQMVADGVQISVQGGIFNTSAHIKVIVTSNLDVTTGAWATWMNSLPASVDLQFEIADAATLKITAQQMHTKVAQGGISIANDGNTDQVSGKVYITGAGLNFDPFNNNDQVRTNIDGREYVGGSLSADDALGFVAAGADDTDGIQRAEWGTNVLVDRTLNGYNRPADVKSYSRLTIDTDQQGDVLGPFTTIETFLRIIGSDDMTFTPMKAGIDEWGAPVAGGSAIRLGVDKGIPTNTFMVDFSEATGTISNLTLAHFDMADAVYGNGTSAAPARVNVELDDNVGDADQGLVSSGVQTFVVTDLNGGAREFWTCATTQDLETLGLRGNYGDFVVFGNTERGVDFLLEAAYSKADGYAVGGVVALFARPGADAVFNITGLSAMPSGEVQKAEGIETINVESITINVSGGDTNIEILAGDAESLTLTADADLTIETPLMGSLGAIDAAGVEGSLTVSIIGRLEDAGIEFTGAEGGTSLTVGDIAAGAFASIAGEGDIEITVNEGGDGVDLSATELTNVTSVSMSDGSTLVLTMDQADDIGAANFALADGDTAELNLLGLSDQEFALANYDVAGTLEVTVTLAEEAAITLNAETDLTGIAELVIPEGTTLTMTAAQFQQLNGAGTITGDGSLLITGLTQADVGEGEDVLNLSDVDLGADSTISLALAGSVDLSEANIAGVSAITFGDNLTLTLGDIEQGDGVSITGGANSTLKFTDIGTDAGDSIDASGFAVTQLMFTNTLGGENNNIDNIFAGLPGAVVKVVYNGEGFATGINQVVNIIAGTTVTTGLDFNPTQIDVELKTLTVNLNGGVEIDGGLSVNTGDKYVDRDDSGDADEGEYLIRTYLQKLTINSAGTQSNLLSGETANVITGDVSGEDNNVLNVEINASQDLVVEGNVVFTSNVGEDGDGDTISANDIEDAEATLTVTGTADVSLGGIDTSDEDVAALNVVNNGTGTLSLTVDAVANEDTELAFTGTGDIELAAEGELDLSDDTLTAVSQITIAEDAVLTLSYEQVVALGADNILSGSTDAAADQEALNIVAYDGSEFDFSTLSDELVINITMAEGDNTLDEAVDLTGVESITVPEGGTLTLTAAQFQQLTGAGTIVGGLDADGNVTTDFSVNITDLTQADVDLDLDEDGDTGGEGEGFVLADVDADSISVSTAEDVNFDANTNLNGASIDIAGYALGLATQGQADGLEVTGTTGSTVTFMFDVAGSIDAAGYDISTLRALAISVDGVDVEFLIDNLDSSVTLNLYEDPNELGYVSPIFRVVTIEPGVAVPGSVAFNGQDDDREVRTLTINFTGDASDRTEAEDSDNNLEGSVITGDLILDRTTEDPDLIATKFLKLTLNSTGAGDSNAIDGSVTADGVVGAGEENNLLNIEINATSDFAVTGAIVFSSIEEDDDAATATLSVNGAGDVTIGSLDVSDADVDALVINTTGAGQLSLTGASPAIDGGVESITFTGTRDITVGTAEAAEDFEDGIDGGGDLTALDASTLSGDLSIENLTGLDTSNFTFTAGTGVTMVNIANALEIPDVDGDGEEVPGVILDFTKAANGSELHLAADITEIDDGGDNVQASFTVLADASTTIYIEVDTDLSTLNASLPQGATIVVADDVTLTLTAAQADGLTIIGAEGDDSTGVVNLVDLDTDAVDLSGISSDVAGTATLAGDDITLDAATNLGHFSVTLTDIADNSDSLAGQTIRFTTEAQATRDIIVDGGADPDESSTNVVWLFNSIAATGGIDTSGYDSSIARLWMGTALVNAEGGDVEQLFTSLPNTILRLDFGTLSELNILLNSNDVDRVMEITSFNTVGNLTFSDIGLTPVEHLNSLTLNLGGQVTVGNIAVADVVGAPGYDPDSVVFDSLTINSFRSVRTGDLLASEGYVNDNDGDNEPKEDSAGAPDGVTGNENTLPVDMNTVGNLSVGAANGLDLLQVNLNTGLVTVEDDASAGQGAQLTVGTITYETDETAQEAQLNITGDNDIFITAVNTADTGITGLTLDATGFTAVLDPVMNMDNTQSLTILNGSADSGTIILSEVEGNELSQVDVSDFGGDVEITLSQLDSTNDDSTPATAANDGLLDAFTYTAGTGVNTVTVQTVGSRVPTLNTDSTWIFDFSDAADGSSLTIGQGVVFQPGANLDVQLSAGTALYIDAGVDITQVNFSLQATAIEVLSGKSLTLTLDQVAQLLEDNIPVVGLGKVVVIDGELNGTDFSDAPYGTILRTAQVDLSALTFDDADEENPDTLTVTMNDEAGSEAIDTDPTDDEVPDNIGQTVTGTDHADTITVISQNNVLNGGAGADELRGGSGKDTLNGGTGDDTLTGDFETDEFGSDTFNVTSGTDTITDLFGDAADTEAEVPENDVLVVSAGATANAAGIPLFVATAATVNNGTANLRGTQVDVSAATGANGFNLFGADADAADSLTGSERADRLEGGLGADALTGNAGADKFAFNVSISTPATMTQSATQVDDGDGGLMDVPHVDQEVLTYGEGTGTGAIRINYFLNGAGANVTTASVDLTDETKVLTAIKNALNGLNGVGAVVDTEETPPVVRASGDGNNSFEVGSVVALGANTLTVTIDAAEEVAMDVAKQVDIILSGDVHPGEVYTVTIAFAEGLSLTADYTSVADDTSASVRDALIAAINTRATELSGADSEQIFAEEIADADDPDTADVVEVGIRLNDLDADNGAFTVSLSTAGAIDGSDASALLSEDGYVADEESLLSVDVVADFVSGTDKVQIEGMAAGSATNYAEAAEVDTFADAFAAANEALNGTVVYYLTSSGADGEEGLLFFDANADGTADGVIHLVGISSANFAATDITVFVPMDPPGAG